MKVLHLINTLSAGGAELHLLTLCRYLKRQGVDVVIACLREDVKGSRPLRPDFEREGITIMDLEARSRYSWWFLGRLVRLLNKEQPDILHSHLPRADIAAAFVRRTARSPVLICSVHGIYRHRWFGTWAAPLMRWAYREADGVIAISHAVRNWLIQDYGIPPEKVNVVYYGIEPECFTHPHDDLRTVLGLEDRAVIGSVGRLEAGKGFDCLIRAMQLVREQLPNTCLLIAGHDPYGYGEMLRALIGELNLEDHVRLIGFQRNIASFYHAIDVFAFASRSEGFGQVVIEAMAAGKPVVVNNIAPLTEIVVTETGLSVQADNPDVFAEALVKLLKDQKTAKEKGEAGARRVKEHFSACTMTQETMRIYQRFLGCND